jgi:endonuclease III related protein
MSGQPGPARVFRVLRDSFGRQGWWPVTPSAVRTARPAYRPGVYAPGSERERFEICAGAILTQNTAWTNVETALMRMHASKLLVVTRLAAVRSAILASCIRSSGYYNQKAARLKAFAGYLSRRHGGSVRRFLSRPTAREELLALNGVGPETADSMLLYAGARPVFVIDAYTKRFAGRFGWKTGLEYAPLQDFFQKNLPKSVPVYNEYHALIVALGKRYCRTKPLCAPCPLKDICARGTRSAGKDRP